MRKERGRALVRALHLSELEEAGNARSAALGVAETQLQRIARLLPDALKGGLSVSEVARTTGLSRPTIYQLKDLHSGGPLAIVQAVAMFQPVTADDVATYVGQSARTVLGVLEGYEDSGWMDRTDEDGIPTHYWVMTAKGEEALEVWSWSVDDNYGQEGQP